MTSFAERCSSEIGRQSDFSSIKCQGCPSGGNGVFSVVCQSLPVSAADLSGDVTGEWEFLGNDTPGTLTINQLRGGSRCKELTGTLDAFTLAR